MATHAPFLDPPTKPCDDIRNRVMARLIRLQQCKATLVKTALEMDRAEKAWKAAQDHALAARDEWMQIAKEVSE